MLTLNLGRYKNGD